MPSALTPRGSTRAWRARRASWTPRLPVPCARCGDPVQPWHTWDLDHTTPVALGGDDSTARPSHRGCNREAGLRLGLELRNERRAFLTDGHTVGRTVAGLSPEAPTLDVVGLSAADSAWDRCGWLEDLRDVPDGSAWPRLMTSPHPDAVGSLGADLAAHALEREGRALRWWQQLVAARMLEHDAAGTLLWLWVLLTTSRQVGKSWLLRALCSWRIEQGARFGEVQDVLHTGKDIAVCREVQRPARAWARRHPELGYRVREVNGQEEIAAADGSRWMLRARDGVYGYGASMNAVDEAWKVAATIVDDGLEPTMVEREQAQGLLTSTAHRRATELFPSRRARALEQLHAPGEELLIEWSARGDADVSDRAAWRAASPQWSPRRERLLEAKLARALAGVVDDPDEDDPVESFRSQWLNIWPGRRLSVGRDGPLVEEAAWAGAVDLSAPVPAGTLVIAVEDNVGAGAAAAAAGVDAGGRLLVWGGLHERRADAFAWAASLAEQRPGSRLLVGASLDGDEALAGIAVLDVTASGQAQTRTALPHLREVLAAGRLVHDGGIELTGQVLGVRVAPTTGGLAVTSRSARSDLLRAAAWAVAEAARAPVEFFVY